MISNIDKALKAYYKKWDALVQQRDNKDFFKKLKPVAVGWKVADLEQYEKLRADMHDQASRIIETWMNGRWIAKVHLRDSELAGGVRIVKVMQRRPGSKDVLGLDHVDFYGPEVVTAESVLEKESNLEWSRENNDVIEGYDWLSIWFDGTEAKLKAGTVLDIIIEELKQVNRQLTKR